ncbi:hypothetical protein P5673_029591 [Acropora cervicornis]|uniref:Ig-like domain-containing protein n=1 Tax=Acropora cervicornis TaxID=6130 RepID=A0AAD9PVK4_ACRCE|nr:hypothetical protein P5673_029591 [Acropora cervicornis]
MLSIKERVMLRCDPNQFEARWTANTTVVITKSLSPSYAVEGQNITLEWTYTLDGSVGSAMFILVNDNRSEEIISKRFRPGVMNFALKNLERFKGEATDTRAELTILAVQRSDEQTYKLHILPTGDGSVSEKVILIVYSKGFGENKTVGKGGRETFSCPVDGVPEPNITWYRGSEVSGTPIFIGEKLEASDTGCYTCVASNSLGMPISITQCLTVEESSATSTTPTRAPEGPSRTVIGVVVGVVVLVVIMAGLVTWWFCKKKKSRKNSKM